MKGSKILIVEDDSTIQTVMKTMLETSGYRVLDAVSSGEAALECVAAQLPDLVVMDIGLEGKIDGIQTASVMRFQYNLPVVFLTANSDEMTLQRVRDTDPFGFILKPVSEHEFFMAIELALYKHYVERQLRDNEFYYRMILRHIGMGVVALDENDRIEFMNEDAEDLTGYALSELRTEHFYKTFNLHRFPVRQPMACVIPNKEHKEIPVTVTLSPILDTGQLKGSVLVITLRND